MDVDVCARLTVRKHLNPFLLLVVVARCGALVAGELWTIWVRGGLSWWVQILIGQKRREKEVLRDGTSRDIRARREQGHDTMIKNINDWKIGQNRAKQKNKRGENRTENRKHEKQQANRFAVLVGAGGVFRLVVWPRESWEIFVMDGEILRLFTGRLGYHANWKNGG